MEGSQSQPISQDELREEDTIKCLIMTDNHVGYLERDAVRGDDSFRTFEECLQIARREKVDCILHAGDLFHHNKPTRRCMYRVMDLLKQYTQGGNPVELELLTRASDNFTSDTVNYMDPNVNVDVPIFAIHGNHDDPAGDGAYSAIDLLANARLLNYFGKHEQVDQLRVAPVVLRKGASQLALYGMGNVRDERLYRAFAEKRVAMLQPTVKDSEDLVSVMLIHQNRVQHSAKNFVTELMLPEFLDLVVWGHEHECLVTPQQAAGRPFFVTQPGSSVATSLIEGESKSKQVALLEINRGRFQVRAIPLQTVRPFVIEDINCSVEGIPKDVKGMQKALAQRVGLLISKGLAQNPDMLPLVRMRLDISNGYEKIPPQRFGAEFVGRVANPDDILHYLKKKARSDVTDSNARSEAAILAARTAYKSGAKQSVENEVRRILASRTKHMSALSERELGDALHNFVEKEDAKAFSSFLDDSLKKVRAHVLEKAKRGGIVELSGDVIRTFAEERVKEEDAIGEEDDGPNYDVLMMDGGGADEDQDEDQEESVPTQKPKRVKKEAVIVLDDEDDKDDDDDDDEEEEEEELLKKKKTAAATTTKKRETKRVAREPALVVEESPPAARKRATRRKSPTKKKRAAATAASQSILAAADDIVDDDDLSRPLVFKKKK